MDYVLPVEVISDAGRAAERKACLSIGDLLIRGALAGVFLGYATSLARMALWRTHARKREEAATPAMAAVAAKVRAG